jgi:starch synthase
MKIVFAVSEIAPYASTGGMADVAAALPAALMHRGVDVMRAMPMYRSVLESDCPKFDTGIRLSIPVGLRSLDAEVWQSAEQGADTFYIRKDEFFDRSQLYSLPERDYDDNFERFVFFQKAIVALIDHLDQPIDVVHANDWQTALVAYFLEHGIHGMGRGRREKVVYTIHNLAYQGTFSDSEFPYTNLPYSCFSLEELEFYGGINSMKGGIIKADRVTTVSPKYAQEILTPAHGCGLEGVLADARDKLSGLLNGVDYSVWDPATDPHIVKSYSSHDLSGKTACREALLARMGMTDLIPQTSTAVLGIVTRLVHQKGLDILADAMESLMAEDVALVLLGSGQDSYQKLALEWAGRWPGRCGVVIGYDQPLSHQIEAGADFFLMPSQFEPCGLNQLYSLRYGTAPIVHATGGLDDTIHDYDQDPLIGNGFKFTEYNAGALLDAVQRGLRVYRDAKAWSALQRRMMQEDYSWDRTAAEYVALYDDLLSNPAV